MTAVESPLAGRRILTCRQDGRGMDMDAGIVEAGGEPIRLPLIEVVPPPDGGAALARALSQLDRFDWIACTSANGVEALTGTELPVGVRLAAVGRATATAFERVLGRSPLVVPAVPTAAGLAAAFPMTTGRVLAPLAELASGDLAVGLRAKGFDVEVVVAYSTIVPAHTETQLSKAATADLVVISSPSVATRLTEVLGGRCPRVGVAFGPRSHQAATELGFDVVEGTPDTVVDDLVRIAGDHGRP